MSFASRFPGFRLRLTRWGAVFLLAVLILVLAAVNTGNNALVVLLGLALGSYTVSGYWSRQVLAAVHAEVRPPREAFAGRPAAVVVELGNSSRLPAYGLVLRDHRDRVLLAEPLLAAGESHQHTVEITFGERGWQPIGPWRLEVLLPLGFFCKSKEVARDTAVLVYPRLHPMAAGATHREGDLACDETMSEHGREGEVTGLREYRDGDEQRQIHWKQTARQERLVVVERQRLDRAAAYLVIDPRVPDPEDRTTRHRFERLVSRAATAVISRLRAYQAIGLVVEDMVIPPVNQPSQAAALLRPLAEVQLRRRRPEDALPPANLVGTISGGGRERSVTPRPAAAPVPYTGRPEERV